MIVNQDFNSENPALCFVQNIKIDVTSMLHPCYIYVRSMLHLCYIYVTVDFEILTILLVILLIQ